MTTLTLRIVLVTATASLFCRSAAAQYGPYPPRVGQQRGAITGGLAGAVIGAIVGENNNEAGAGAAIGGAIGAVAGGVLGNAADKERAYAGVPQPLVPRQTVPRPVTVAPAVVTPRPVYQTPQYTTPAYVPPQQCVGITDVINMSRSGLGEPVIINQIAARGVTTELTVADIIELHRQGVSERVITTMQQTPVGTPAAVAVARVPTPVQTPVIVREQVVVPHPVNVHHYHGPRRRYPRGF